MILPKQLAHLHAACFTASRPWTANEFISLLQNPHCFVVGDHHCFAMVRVIIDEAEILTLATHPEHRRLGLAKSVLCALESEARTRNASKIFLEVAKDNAAAVTLYQNSGYGIGATRRNYYRRSGLPSVDALIMNKKI